MPGRKEQKGGTTFHKVLENVVGNNAKYQIVQIGQHLKDAEAKRTLENPKLHPGLMARHMLGIK
jgi:hypothetical protein